jgi:Uncharacterized conserved protein (COG2071)
VKRWLAWLRGTPRTLALGGTGSCLRSGRQSAPREVICAMSDAERLPRRLADVLEIGALPSAAHRPWPLPNRPWVMAQRWERLLFAHWPMPERTLRPLVPGGLTLQTFEGQAWIALTPFVVSVLRPRVAPQIPSLAPFPELNVRQKSKPGSLPRIYQPQGSDN